MDSTSLFKLAPSLTLGLLGLVWAAHIAAPECPPQTECPEQAAPLQQAACLPQDACLQPTECQQQDIEPNRKLRILVTNDDGVRSPALLAMARELRKLGDVVVVAPDRNRSGCSHSTDGRSTGIRVKNVALDGIDEAYSVDEMPADAVAFGLRHLGREKPFDVVVSGANMGSNVGLDAQYSGTVGAAMEAVYLGVPGVAVSQSRSQRDHTIAARFTRQFVARLMQAGAKKGIGYNINVPDVKAADIKGVVVAGMGRPKKSVSGWRRGRGGRPGGRRLGARRFGGRRPGGRGARGGEARWTVQYSQAREGTLDGDTAAYRSGNITVAPMRLDRTDAASVKAMQQWGLKAR